eukprot:359700-Chlamydomonas_euryale.AAC.2
MEIFRPYLERRKWASVSRTFGFRAAARAQCGTQQPCNPLLTCAPPTCLNLCAHPTVCAEQHRTAAQLAPDATRNYLTA